MVRGSIWIPALCGLLWAVAAGEAQEVAAPPRSLENLRTLYVPVDALDAALQGDKFGAVLSRAEFQRLIEGSGWAPSAGGPPPTAAVVPSAEYDVTLDGDQLRAATRVRLRTFGPKGDEVSLRIAGWSVEAALLDGEPAVVTRVGEQRDVLQLFVPRAGSHELQLTLSAPLRAVGSDKLAAVSTVGAAAETMSVQVPAGKFVKLGDVTPERPAPADQPARYSLSLGGAAGSRVELTVTDRRESSRAGILTFANTAHGVRVQPGEIGWIGRTELQVFGEPLSKVVCSVPHGLEISSVESMGLESWELADAADGSPRTEITLLFRQPFDGTRRLTFQGVLAGTSDESWTVPNLVIAGTTSHVGAVVILHPPNLRLQIVEQSGVRPVADLAGAAELFPNEQGRQFFQVWEEQFGLRFATVLKEVQVQAAMTNIVDINPLGIDLSTALSLQTRLAPLFEARLRLPAEYRVNSVLVEGAETAWETVPAVAGVNEVRIPLSPPLLPGETRNLAVVAHLEPETWPVTATPLRIAIPEVRLPQASMVEALYGITGPPDLELVPVELTGLDPARRSDLDQLNGKLAGTGRQVLLGFTYQDTVFTGHLEISRRPTRVSAQNTQFFRIDRETLFTRLESALTVEGGGVRELQVQVGEGAGTALRFLLAPRFRGSAPGRIVEQTASEPENGVRTITLKFDTYLHGDHLLITEVRQPREQAESHSPPRFTIVGADVQTGFLAIESAPDEFVRVTAQSATGEPLTKVDPVDFPTTLYRPSERMVAGFRAARPDWTVTVAAERFDRSPVPTAVGHSGALVSVLGSAGDIQHRMRVEFTAVGIQNLRITMPQDASLWATLLDDRPIEARRTGDQVLLPLTGLDPEQRHSLEVSYATSVPEGASRTELKTLPPEIAAMTGAGDEQPLEILKQEWLLHYPEGSLLVESLGAFRPVGKLFGFTIFDELKSLIRLPKGTTLLESLLVLGLAALVLLLIGGVWRRTAGTGCLKITLGTLGVVGLVWLLFWAQVLSLGLGRSPMNSADRYDVAATSAPSPAADEYFDAPAVPAESVPMDAFGVAPSEAAREWAVQPVQEKRMQVMQAFGDKAESVQEAAPQEERERLLRSRSMFGREERKMIEGETAAPDDILAGRRRFIGQNGQADPGAVTRGVTPPAPANEPAAVELNVPHRPGLPTIVEMDRSLSLQVRQNQQVAPPQPMAGKPASSELASGARFVLPISGGLLSMSIGLQVPAESLSQKFEYQGNGTPAGETGLELRFADRRMNRMLVGAVALGTALLGWWLRRAGGTVQGCWVFLTVVLPIALIGLVPGLYESTLLGVLLGGTATLAGWLLVACVRCCGWCLSHFSPAFWGKPLFALAVTGLGGLSAELRAEEKTPVPAPAPFVVIPYESWDRIEQADKVWVPAELYRQLWNAAHAEDAPTPARSILGTVAEGTYLVRIGEGSEPHVVVQARWVVVNATEKPLTVPVPLKRLTPTAVSVNGLPAALTVDDRGQPAFVVHEPGIHVVDAALRVPAQIQKSVGQFFLQLTPIGSGVLTFELPTAEEELTVRVGGTTAAFRRVNVDDKARVEIPIDQGGNLTLHWQPQTGQGNVDQLVQVQTAIALEVSDPGIHERCGFRVTVRQGGLNDFTFDLPEGLAVQRIDGQDVAGWELIEEPAGRRLKVFFRRTIQDTTDFTLDLFVNRPVRMDAETPAFPLIAPLGASRETGLLTIAAAEHLRLRVAEATGLQQIDLKQYQPIVAPSAVANSPQVAYRFAARPVVLTAEVGRRVAEVRSKIEHGVDVGPRKIIVASRFVLELTGTPQRLLEFRLPQGYLTMDVVCEQAIDWYEVKDEERTRLVIELDRPVIGTVEVGLEGHLVKTPEAGEVTAALPEFPGAARGDMLLGIWFDPVYQASLVDGGSWRPTPVGGLEGILRLQGTLPQFGFRNTDTGGPLRFQVRRAAPTLTADQATLIAVTDAAVDYGFTVRWNIANASADLLTFTVPDWLGRLDITGSGIRQTRSAPAGNGRTRWSITLVDPVAGQYLITAAATIPMPADRIVRTPQVEIEAAGATGEFAPLETQRTFAVTVNLSPGQLIPVDLEQFESVAADQLPLTLPQGLVQQAMEIVRVRPDKLPQWRVERIETADGPQAVVPAATLTTALEMDGSWRTRAVYAVRNRGQQFLGVRIPEESRLLSVIVRGVPSRTVIARVGDAAVHLIALPQTSDVDLSFDVSLLLAGRLGRSLPEALSLLGREITFPAPQVVTRTESAEFGLTVAQTLWTVHLPEELDAAPIKDPSATNLTWHVDSVWLAEERQRLDRIRADMTEMIRIAADKKAGYFRRSEALSNLKHLQSLALSSSGEGGSVPSSSEFDLKGGTQMLYDEAAKAIADNETSIAEAQDRDGDGLAQEQGRALILNLNKDLYLGNSITTDGEAEVNQAGKSLNFYGVEDARRSGAKKQDAVPFGSSRGTLKEQLANQAPIVQERLELSEQGQLSSFHQGRYGGFQQGQMGGGLGGAEYSSDGAVLGDRLHVPQSSTTWSMDFVQDADLLLGAIDLAAEQAGAAATSPQWTGTGGLSIVMELPTGGQQLAFSKVGGNPKLTLSVRPRETWIKLLAGVWCVACLAVGYWVLRNVGRSGTWIGLFGALALLAIITGIAGFLLLTVELRWAFFILFCGGGLLKALLGGYRPRPATENAA